MVKKRMGVRHELFQFDHPTAEKNLGEARAGERKRWAGFLPVRAKIVAQKRFALRSVIATR